MKRASVTQAKNGLSALLREVERGERVLITSRGRPIAILAPFDLGHLNDDAQLAELVARGVITPPRNPKGIDLEKFRALERPKLPPGVTVQDLIDWEREDRF